MVSIVDAIAEEIFKNTRPDPDQWVWYKGKMYRKDKAAEFLAAVKENETDRQDRLNCSGTICQT